MAIAAYFDCGLGGNAEQDKLVGGWLARRWAEQLHAGLDLDSTLHLLLGCAASSLSCPSTPTPTRMILHLRLNSLPQHVVR